MENNRTSVILGFVVIAFLVVTVVLIRDFRAQRDNDYKDFTKILRITNFQIKVLNYALRTKQRENQELKNILSVTRNDLDTLSRKIAQQSPASIPPAAPVAAVAK